MENGSKPAELKDFLRREPSRGNSDCQLLLRVTFFAFPSPSLAGHSRSDLVNLEPRGFRSRDRIGPRTFSLRANRRFEFTHCDLRSAARIASPRSNKSHVIRRKFRRRFSLAGPPARANMFPGMEENCAMDQPRLFSILPDAVLRIE